MNEVRDEDRQAAAATMPVNKPADRDDGKLERIRGLTLRYHRPADVSTVRIAMKSDLLVLSDGRSTCTARDDAPRAGQTLELPSATCGRNQKQGTAKDAEKGEKRGC